MNELSIITQTINKSVNIQTNSSNYKLGIDSIRIRFYDYYNELQSNIQLKNLYIKKTRNGNIVINNSLSKYYFNTNNRNSFTEQEFQDCIFRLNNDLAKIGIYKNLFDDDVFIDKIDLFTDYSPNHSTYLYIETFQKLKSKYQQKTNILYKNETVYLGTKSKQLVMYDKATESSFDANLLRIELRLNDPRGVQSLVGIPTLPELIKLYPNIQRRANKLITDRFMVMEPETLEFNPSQVNLIDNTKVLELLGYAKLYPNISYLKLAELIVQQKIGNGKIQPTSKAATLSKYRKAAEQAEMMKQATASCTTADLYSEIKQLFN